MAPAGVAFRAFFIPFVKDRGARNDSTTSPKGKPKKTRWRLALAHARLLTKGETRDLGMALISHRRARVCAGGMTDQKA